MKWFGQSWGAATNRQTEHVETPVGEACAGCGWPIEPEAYGFVLPHVDAQGESAPPKFSKVAWHADCLFENVGVGPRRVKPPPNLPPEWQPSPGGGYRTKDAAWYLTYDEDYAMARLAVQALPTGMFRTLPFSVLAALLNAVDVKLVGFEPKVSASDCECRSWWRSEEAVTPPELNSSEELISHHPECGYYVPPDLAAAVEKPACGHTVENTYGQIGFPASNTVYTCPTCKLTVSEALPLKPQELFAPERMLMHLDDAASIIESGTEAAAYIAARRAAGDTSPVHIEDGDIWTEQDEEENGRAGELPDTLYSEVSINMSPPESVSPEDLPNLDAVAEAICKLARDHGCVLCDYDLCIKIPAHLEEAAAPDPPASPAEPKFLSDAVQQRLADKIASVDFNAPRLTWCQNCGASGTIEPVKPLEHGLRCSVCGERYQTTEEAVREERITTTLARVAEAAYTMVEEPAAAITTIRKLLGASDGELDLILGKKTMLEKMLFVVRRCFEECQGMTAYSTDESDQYYELGHELMRLYAEGTEEEMEREGTVHDDGDSLSRTRLETAWRLLNLSKSYLPKGEALRLEVKEFLETTKFAAPEPRCRTSSTGCCAGAPETSAEPSSSAEPSTLATAQSSDGPSEGRPRPDHPKDGPSESRPDGAAVHSPIAASTATVLGVRSAPWQATGAGGKAGVCSSTMVATGGVGGAGGGTTTLASSRSIFSEIDAHLARWERAHRIAQQVVARCHGIEICIRAISTGRGSACVSFQFLTNPGIAECSFELHDEPSGRGSFYGGGADVEQTNSDEDIAKRCAKVIVMGTP